MRDVVIACEGIWKSYRIYNQRSHTLKEKLVRGHWSRFEEFWALRGIDLEVYTGTTTGIIGANGSGKSTLLKTMARIHTPNRGRVSVEGTVSPLLELGTGFHPELTGRENLYLGGSVLGQSRRDIDNRLDDIVDFADIGAFIDSPVKNYSSGMYARLAFALAINVDADILLVDEVLAVGDESFQMRCWERIANLRAEGRTIVLVSHGLEAIRSLCQNAAWIDKGVIREAGQSHDVIAAYLNHVHGGASAAETSAGGGQRFGTGEATVTEVTFLDGEATATTAFRTGQTMTINVRYRVQERLDDLSCAIAVHRAETLAYVFGQSTKAAGVTLAATGEAVVELTITDLPLLQGNYVVTVALHHRSTKAIYDFHERRYSFMVFTNPDLPEEAGTVHVASEWNALPAPVPV
ncbi:MAG TPA: ABC transporter ATP-binding protein [Acidimicrobiales bacterium]|jgi:ABC-2 type transport system ATP-binding protein